MSEQRVVPMIHVPDVRATVEWYRSIGFVVLNTYEDENVMTFALLSFGNSEIMLSAGGRQDLSSSGRRVWSASIGAGGFTMRINWSGLAVAGAFYALLGSALDRGVDDGSLQSIALVVLIVAGGWLVGAGIIGESTFGPLWPRRWIRK